MIPVCLNDSRPRVMAGIDPAIGYPRQLANDAIPLSNHSMADGGVDTCETIARHPSGPAAIDGVGNTVNGRRTSDGAKANPDEDKSNSNRKSRSVR